MSVRWQMGERRRWGGRRRWRRRRQRRRQRRRRGDESVSAWGNWKGRIQTYCSSWERAIIWYHQTVMNLRRQERRVEGQGCGSEGKRRWEGVNKNRKTQEWNRRVLGWNGKAEGEKWNRHLLNYGEWSECKDQNKPSLSLSLSLSLGNTLSTTTLPTMLLDCRHVPVQIQMPVTVNVVSSC